MTVIVAKHALRNTISLLHREASTDSRRSKAECPLRLSRSHLLSQCACSRCQSILAWCEVSCSTSTSRALARARIVAGLAFCLRFSIRQIVTRLTPDFSARSVKDNARRSLKNLKFAFTLACLIRIVALSYCIYVINKSQRPKSGHDHSWK